MSEPIELHCLRATENPHTRVLLLHGLANSAAIWRSVTDGWPDGVEVWAADLPWRGTGSRSWSWQSDCAQWIEQAAARVPGGTDVLVAHSMSANAVLELLSATEAGYRAVVLVAPFYRADPEEFDWPAVQRSIANFEHTITEGIRTHAAGRIPEERIAELGRLVCEKTGPYAWSRFFTMYLNTPWLRTSAIRIPVRVLSGGRDETAPAAEGQRLAEALPSGSVRVLAESGHFPMIEFPGEFRAAVCEFLNQYQTVACGVS
ncbi:alpha/beta fold hydrolase [Sciscionella sediminilitoris]|uniref:alpha/beta fold hydrolase n=1 Tax=Sciscionella sediminilitoris TaxID=1445613 RepID=UPI000689E620|nr:alpha/beta fold hydrolase [Sciscionella sp. SE31]